MFTPALIEKTGYKILLLTFIIFLIFTDTYSQQDKQFIPAEIKQAYENNTRSLDGTPGENYWQNTVDYDIEVFPLSQELKGTAIITYHNNSPDRLSKIIMRINHYAFSEGYEGMEILRLTYNNSAIDLENDIKRGETNMHVQLPQILQSGSAAILEVDWSMPIEQTTTKDSTSFFITNWFPEVAVYDDIFGWDEELSQQLRAIQFYRNPGNYNVNIKAPKSYTVVATGELKNGSEVLPAKQYQLFEKAKLSDEPVTIISREEIDKNYVNKSTTWNYQASEITAFAFGLSDHYALEGAKFNTGDRPVFITTYYDVSHEEDPKDIISNQQKYIKYFSEEMPGIPYPFPEFTSFIVGSGGATGGAMIERLWGTNLHNMLHQYFPRYVRINEKHFTWMDEGILNFNTAYLVREFLHDDQRFIFEGYDNLPLMGSVEDLPLIVSSQYLDNTSYNQAPIKLTEFIFAMLHHELGYETFTNAYSEFIRNWAKKSPTPYDLFNTFERISGRELDWFWEPWFFSIGNVGVAISSLNKGELTIDNEGTRPVPVVVNVAYRDGSVWKTDLKASVWKDSDEVVINLPDYENIKNLAVNKYLPDTDIFNNYYPNLKDRFDEKIDNKYLGEYSINEMPLDAFIQIKKNIILMTLNGLGEIREAYFIPKSNNTYQSLTGDYILTLEEKSEGIHLKLSNDSGGRSLTGQKL